ncbi:invasion associated locus B family protein [Sulfitobacter sp. S190]|nr:invasion associated locus B family protein [Sulfitobacter sp. S190]
MFKIMTALPLCAAVAFMTPMTGFAQSTDADADAPAAATETDQSEDAGADEGITIEDQLSLGEDPNATPQVGQPYTREVIGGWDMRCIRAEEGSDAEEPCQMYQLMKDEQDVPVAEVSLFRLPAGGKAVAGATVIVPLETSLQKQLTVTVDGANARRYPFAFCNQIGCYVRMGLTEADISAFKRGAKAELSITPALAPDQTVKVTMSLDGFTASFDKVSVVDQ